LLECANVLRYDDPMKWLINVALFFSSSLHAADFCPLELGDRYLSFETGVSDGSSKPLRLVLPEPALITSSDPGFAAALRFALRELYGEKSFHIRFETKPNELLIFKDAALTDVSWCRISCRLEEDPRVSEAVAFERWRAGSSRRVTVRTLAPQGDTWDLPEISVIEEEPVPARSGMRLPMLATPVYRSQFGPQPHVSTYRSNCHCVCVNGRPTWRCH
jgi:hypothetical protein